MLYAGDRKDASEMISAWLKEGKIVILDRYTYSNIAYQCAKTGSVREEKKLRKWILDLEFEHFAIPQPDLNIFLDVPFRFTENKLTAERKGNDRVYLKGLEDIHESSLNFQKRVREIYLNVASSDDRLAVINCSAADGGMLPPNDIFVKILELIRNRNLI